MEYQTRIEIYGTPRFVIESGELGKFGLVESIEFDLSEEGVEKQCHMFYGDFLEVGLDIIETPVDFYLWVTRTKSHEHDIRNTLRELKKLAYISEHDYFSYHLSGNLISHNICSIRGLEHMQIKPRLFRKLVND
jgi:hypothetical protein